MNDSYVYVHIAPDTNVPFYVGKGQGRRAFDTYRSWFWQMFVDDYCPNTRIFSEESIFATFPVDP